MVASAIISVRVDVDWRIDGRLVSSMETVIMMLTIIGKLYTKYHLLLDHASSSAGALA